MFGEVAGQVSLPDGVPVESPQSGKGQVEGFTAERTLTRALARAVRGTLSFVVQELQQVLERDLPPVLQLMGSSPGDKTSQGVGIGFLRGLALAAFVPQVHQKILHQRMHNPQRITRLRALQLRIARRGGVSVEARQGEPRLAALRPGAGQLGCGPVPNARGRTGAG